MKRQRTLVLAPHADDETLGVGGTLARLAEEGQEVHVAVLTRGTLPAFSDAYVATVREEARRAHALLGVHHTRFLDLPAAHLDTLPHAEINRALSALLAEVRPHTLFIPFAGDIHLDHQLIAASAMVASRPCLVDHPASIYAYETLSETNWNAPAVSPPFVPNHFVDITAHLERKLSALSCFESQMRPAPHERSLEAARALAVLRGATVGLHAAEAFVTLRTIV